MTNNQKLISQNKKTKIKFSDTKEGGILLENSESPNMRQALIKAFGGNDFDIVDLLTDGISRIASNGKEIANAKEMNFAVSFLQEINPQDPVEAMLAIQMLGTHFLSCKTLHRGSLNNQTFEGVSENINRATKLNRTYIAQMDALKKYRNKGNQKITVEHINVNEGGKAVIGSTINNQINNKND